ncbi:MAG TPA: tetratricopeptide repeat protein [Acidobacteriaceae bacterium]
MVRSLASMLMSLTTVLTIGLAGAPANCQQADAGAPQTLSGISKSEADFSSRAELTRRIGLYETAERDAEAAHVDMQSMLKIYSSLAALYEDAAMYAKSEALMRREIAMLQNGPQRELAEAIGHLAVLHIAMGDFRQAEKDELEAMQVRQSVGDPMGTALTWNDLADIYIKERKFKPALDYAQRAMKVLADDPKVDPADRIIVRQTLAYALCGLKQCAQAIPLLKDAVEMEKTTYGADSLLVGNGTFLLGYVYWQNGDMEDAATLMARGTARMKVDLGWGHVVYLDAMNEYARFLRQRGQKEAAASAEREIKMANSVVDVNSLGTRQSAFVPAGPR